MPRRILRLEYIDSKNFYGINWLLHQNKFLSLATDSFALIPHHVTRS